MADEELFPDGGPTQKRSRAPSKQRAPNGIPAVDPLTDEQAESLLIFVGIVRDPLHGDIRLTELERTLIDTTAFQRLRRVTQLAMVDMVYPGAVHNRFLHSLGVLHVCSEMLTACNNTANSFRRLAEPGHPLPVTIGPYAHLLARLVAILHDMAHIPFGHVLEREAQVIEKDEWEDPWRVSQTLGKESQFANTFRTFIRDHFSSAEETIRMDDQAARKAADAILDEVLKILTAKKSNDVLALRYPFVYDLVSNTICADLIDYVQRDMYFCGLSASIGMRFIQYLGVVPTKYAKCELEKEEHAIGKPYRTDDDQEYAQPRASQGQGARVGRVALLLYRYNQRHAARTKPYILAEAIDLVRRRKLLAETLYFHKTKLIATAMLGAAAHAGGITDAKGIWDKSDREVLKMLAASASGSTPASPDSVDRDADPVEAKRILRAQTLAQKLLDRKLFKPIYRVPFYPKGETGVSAKLWNKESGAYERYIKPANREELIDQIEEIIGVANKQDATWAIGCVSISCPKEDMQLKGFDMLVLANPRIPELKPLQQTVQPTIKKDIDVIQQGHKELWSLEVSVDPDALDIEGSFARKIAGALEHEIGLQNELEGFTDVTPIPIEELRWNVTVDAELESLGITGRITKVHHKLLVTQALAARGGAAGSREELLQMIRRFVKDKGYLSK